jgi:hypothetical protein
MALPVQVHAFCKPQHKTGENDDASQHALSKRFLLARLWTTTAHRSELGGLSHRAEMRRGAGASKQKHKRSQLTTSVYFLQWSQYMRNIGTPEHTRTGSDDTVSAQAIHRATREQSEARNTDSSSPHKRPHAKVAPAMHTSFDVFEKVDVLRPTVSLWCPSLCAPTEFSACRPPVIPLWCPDLQMSHAGDPDQVLQQLTKLHGVKDFVVLNRIGESAALSLSRRSQRGEQSNPGSLAAGVSRYSDQIQHRHDGDPRHQDQWVGE